VCVTKQWKQHTFVLHSPLESHNDRLPGQIVQERFWVNWDRLQYNKNKWKLSMHLRFFIFFLKKKVVAVTGDPASASRASKFQVFDMAWFLALAHNQPGVAAPQPEYQLLPTAVYPVIKNRLLTG
jgi:hypothetical protein